MACSCGAGADPPGAKLRRRPADGPQPGPQAAHRSPGGLRVMAQLPAQDFGASAARILSSGVIDAPVGR